MMGTGLFLVALGLIQTCLARVDTRVPVQPGFQYKKLEGGWYALAVVIRGFAPSVVAPKIRIFPLSNGDLDMGRNQKVWKSCRFVEHRYINVGEPGVFKVSEKWGGQPVNVHVVATDYTEYMVLHFKSGRNVSLYLFGRRMEASTAAKRQFNHYRRSLRISGTVKYPRLDETCT